MARLFRFAITRQGNRGKESLIYDSNYSPDVNYIFQRRINIEFENDFERGMRLELTLAEAKEIKRQFEEQGI